MGVWKCEDLWTEFWHLSESIYPERSTRKPNRMTQLPSLIGYASDNIIDT